MKPLTVVAGSLYWSLAVMNAGAEPLNGWHNSTWGMSVQQVQAAEKDAKPCPNGIRPLCMPVQLGNMDFTAYFTFKANTLTQVELFKRPSSAETQAALEQ